MIKKIHAVQFGCGPIGCSVAKLALQRPDIELVGAVDIDKEKAGRDLGELIGLDRELGVRVTDDAESLFHRRKVDVVFHQTSSSLKTVAPQLIRFLKWGSNVISTTEELAYPYRSHPKLAAHIDRVARANRVTVLGTGVNPGFLMDSWVLFMTAVCQEVKKVKAVRVQDASSRRLSFQKKIGAGCTLREFSKKVHQGTLRHVGITESISMIASGLGWKLDDIRETIKPVIAKKRVRSQFSTVESGQAAGVRQVGRGFRGKEELITLEFEASLGAREPYDAIHITGLPNMEVVIKGGLHGDLATAAITVNAVRRVVEAQPGLITMKDLPIITCRS